MTGGPPLAHYVTMIQALILLAILATIALGVWLHQRSMGAINRSIQENTSRLQEVRQATDDLRLKSRTRIGTAKVPTGIPSEVPALQRLGRTTAAKRRVVGGEEGSAQRANLQTSVEQGMSPEATEDARED